MPEPSRAAPITPATVVPWLSVEVPICVGAAVGRIVVEIQQVVRTEVSMAVVDAVVDHTDLDARAGIVLPRLGDVDAGSAARQIPFFVKIRIRRQRRSPGRRVQRLPMDRNVMEHGRGGALAQAVPVPVVPPEPAVVPPLVVPPLVLPPPPPFLAAAASGPAPRVVTGGVEATCAASPASRGIQRPAQRPGRRQDQVPVVGACVRSVRVVVAGNVREIEMVGDAPLLQFSLRCRRTRRLIGAPNKGRVGLPAVPGGI